MVLHAFELLTITRAVQKIEKLLHFPRFFRFGLSRIFQFPRSFYPRMRVKTGMRGKKTIG